MRMALYRKAKLYLAVGKIKPANFTRTLLCLICIGAFALFFQNCSSGFNAASQAEAVSESSTSSGSTSSSSNNTSNTGIKTFSVDTYGADPTGNADSTAAIQNAINAAIASGVSSQVVLSAGTYKLACAIPIADFGSCLAIQKAQNLNFTGSQTNIVITNPQAGFIMVTASSNVQISNLVLDYNPLPFTQGKVIAVNPAGLTLDVQLDAGMPLLSHPMFAATMAQSFGMVFDSSTLELKQNVNNWVESSPGAQLNSNTWRINFSSWNQADLQNTSVGDEFVQLARNPYSEIEFYNNPGDIALTGVTAYASLGIFAVGAYNSGNMTVKSNRLVRYPGPGTTRMISSNADAFHFLGNRGSILLDSNVVQAASDDFLNILSTGVPIACVGSDPSCPVTGAGLQSNSFLTSDLNDGTWLQAGDLIQFVNTNTYQVNATATIASISEVSSSSTHYLQVTLTSTVPMSSGDTVYDWNLTSPNSMIQNNTFLSGRGVFRLRSSAASFQYNYIQDPRNAVLYVGDDIETEWSEGPVSSVAAITFSDNVVENTNNVQAIANNTIVAANSNYSTNQFAMYGSFEVQGNEGVTLPSLQTWGAAELHPYVFNWQYYLSVNPDIASMSESQAIAHWLSNGQYEGRTAAAGFVSSEYLGEYADLQAAVAALSSAAGKAWAVNHYAINGRIEGRLGRSSAMPVGQYRLPDGGIYYLNGVGAMCYYNSMTGFDALGGNTNLNGTALPWAVALFPATIISNGACASQ